MKKKKKRSLIDSGRVITGRQRSLPGPGPPGPATRCSSPGDVAYSLYRPGNSAKNLADIAVVQFLGGGHVRAKA